MSEDGVDKLFYKKEKIGRGTYAVVYKAYPLTETPSEGSPRGNISPIALKKFLLFHDEDGVINSTLRELSILRLCDHENIIKIQWYDSRDFRYFSMPLYDYDLDRFNKIILSSGRNRISKERSVELTLDVSRQIVKGVNYLHTMGIIHRDIKPQNIMVRAVSTLGNTEYRVALIDMSLSVKVCPSDISGFKNPDVCTLWYRPPELLLGMGNYNHKIDIWSVGCVIAELVLKRVLFPGDSVEDQLNKIVSIFGVPTESAWTGISYLRNYHLLNKLNRADNNNNFKTVFTGTDQQILSLIEKMLVMNPKNRENPMQISMGNMLENPEGNITDSWLATDPMTDQTYITIRMRTILLNWLVELILDNGLPNRIYLVTQQILDKYLSVIKNLPSSRYQLLGVTAMLIACKLTEDHAPSVEDYLGFCAGIYTEKDLYQTERDILTTLDLNLYVPNAYNFIPHLRDKYGLNSFQTIEIEYISIYNTFNTDLLLYHPRLLVETAMSFLPGFSLSLGNNNPDNLYNPIHNSMKQWISNGTIVNLGDMSGLNKLFRDYPGIIERYKMRRPDHS